jgi:hypothetical protein
MFVGVAASPSEGSVFPYMMRLICEALRKIKQATAHDQNMDVFQDKRACWSEALSGPNFRSEVSSVSG